MQFYHVYLCLSLVFFYCHGAAEKECALKGKTQSGHSLVPVKYCKYHRIFIVQPARQQEMLVPTGNPRHALFPAHSREENKRQAQVNMIKLHNTVPCFRASQLLSDFETKIRFGVWKEIRGYTPQWKAKRINKKPWYVPTLRIQLRPCVVALFWNVSNFPDLLINFIRLRRLSLWQ